MNANQFNRKARRAVQKKTKKLGRKLDNSEVKNLKIQKAPLWAQTVVVLLGLFLISFGLYAEWEHENTLLFILFSLGGLCVFLIGFFGKKETVEESAGTFVSQSAEGAIDKLIDSL